ncbi:recombination associated protein RdgC [Advenella incenata]|uniref:Recombination-associated protein RdgC n=2 Tax=Advenella incenata TaxID=267800 RepID=A0A4Q7VUT7_9BURK|nr:recombination associated protein RdgC [Advenella incenata]
MCDNDSRYNKYFWRKSMWFKNLSVYRLAADWKPTQEELEDKLAKAAFVPGNKSDMNSMGWVPARENGMLAHALSGQYLLSLRIEKKLLPATVINQFTRVRAQEIEEQQGYKPGRKQMREIKEQVTDTLLPKAFSIFRDTRVWIDTQNHWLVIDAASATKADEVIGALAKVIDPLPLKSLYTEQSPAAAMTEWLLADEAPAMFSVDQDTELQSSSENKATIRYVRQSPEKEDVQKHIQSGKQCTKLALTWSDRISFVLSDNLIIKRIAPLDILKENQDMSAMDEEERFDADMTLMTAELAGLLGALVEALGGEKQTAK